MKPLLARLLDIGKALIASIREYQEHRTKNKTPYL
jgi:hypothetical protein